MSSTTLDKSRYGELLAETLPAVIRTQSEYRRLLKVARNLVEKPDDEITEEEGRLLDLVSMLIEAYEDRVHPLPKAEPHKMLAHLLEAENLKPSDLWDILPKSRVSEILCGKRSISKAQAKQLAERLRVPMEVFF